MNRGIRFLLLGAIILLFLIVAPGTILYATGLRLDLKEGRLVRVGGLFLDPFPEDALITIEGRVTRSKRTSTLSPNAFFSGLLPGSYTVRIEKDGFHQWVKTLRVEPQLTTTARRILLFPLSPQWEKLIEEKDLSLAAPSHGMDLLWSTERRDANRASIFLTTFKTQTPEGRESAEITQEVVDVSGTIASIEWSEEDSAALLHILQKNGGSIFLLTLKAGRPFIFPLTPEIVWARFSIQNPELLFALRRNPKTQDLALIDFSSRDASFLASKPVLKKGVALAKPVEGGVVFLDREGILWRMEKTNGEETLQLTNTPLPTIPEPESAELLVQGNTVVLLDHKSELLMLFDANERAFVPLADGVQGASFSSSGTKILYWNAFELWVYFTETAELDERYEKGEHHLITRLSIPIRQALWYPQEETYILFAVGNAIKVTELDGRDKRSTYDLFLGKEPRMMLDNQRAILFIQDNDTLLKSQLLVPPKYDLGALGL